MAELTQKQERFVAAYAGHAAEAAIAAGYSSKTARQIASALLSKPHVAKAMRERDEKTLRPLIASRLERQAFWTATMNDGSLKMADRLKASELLGRSECDFLDRVEGTITLTAAAIAASVEGEESVPPALPNALGDAGEPAEQGGGTSAGDEGRAE